jgi:hypothetical protein
MTLIPFSSPGIDRRSLGHEEYPQRIASTIDTTSEMLGSVKPYRRQVHLLQSSFRSLVYLIIRPGGHLDR